MYSSLASFMSRTAQQLHPFQEQGKAWTGGAPLRARLQPRQPRHFLDTIYQNPAYNVAGTCLVGESVALAVVHLGPNVCDMDVPRKRVPTPPRQIATIGAPEEITPAGVAHGSSLSPAHKKQRLGNNPDVEEPAETPSAKPNGTGAAEGGAGGKRESVSYVGKGRGSNPASHAALRQYQDATFGPKATLDEDFEIFKRKTGPKSPRGKGKK